jgi:hypothetical protein
MNIPPIAIEYNEGGHSGYNKLDENTRQSVIEYFGNRMVNIPITRQVTDQELGIILDKVAEDVISLLKELTIDYNPDITEDRLCEIIRKNSVDRDFISMFINGCGKSPYEKYKYCHTDVAEYLGYSTENLRRDFNKSFIKINNCNYVVKTLKEIKQDLSVRSTVHLNNDNLSVRSTVQLFWNEYKARSDAKFYFINRVGFYQLCMASTKPKARVVREYFVEVYEAVMTYVCRSRKRNIDRLVKVKESIPIVEQRIKKRVDDSLNKFDSKKMAKELEEKNEYMKKMKKKIDELTDQKKQDDRIMSENNTFIKQIQLSQYEAEEKVEELKSKIVDQDEKVEKLKSKIDKLVPIYNSSVRSNKQKQLLLSDKNKQLQKEVDKNSEKDLEICRLMKLLEEKSVKKLLRKPKPIIKPLIIDEVKNDPIVEPVVEVKTVKYNKTVFSIKTVKELKDICRTSGVGGYSGMTKSVLIEWMMTKDQIMK